MALIQIPPTENLTKQQMDKFYAVRYKGKIVAYLSPRLAAKQNALSKSKGEIVPPVTVACLKELKNAHRKRLRLFDKIRKENDPVKLHELAEQITEFEYTLQDLWGFERDINYHSWWYRAPKCTCAKMDNRECLGNPRNSVNLNCPLHGELSV